MIIYFEPHASSLDNEAGLASGHNDVELSDDGRSEAQSKRQRLSNVGMEIIYTSDLKRAYKTAEVLADKTSTPIVKDIRLRECDYGTMTRKSRIEVFQARKSRVITPFPDGESYCQVVNRVKSFLDELFQQNVFHTILIIGHFATLVGLEYWLNGRQILDSLQIDYAKTEFPVSYFIDEVMENSIRGKMNRWKEYNDSRNEV